MSGRSGGNGGDRDGGLPAELAELGRISVDEAALRRMAAEAVRVQKHRQDVRSKVTSAAAAAVLLVGGVVGLSRLLAVSGSGSNSATSGSDAGGRAPVATSGQPGVTVGGYRLLRLPAGYRPGRPDPLADGDGREIILVRDLPTGGIRSITVRIVPAGASWMVGSGSGAGVRIHGRPAAVTLRPGGVAVRWTEHGSGLSVAGTPGVPRDTVLAVARGLHRTGS